MTTTDHIVIPRAELPAVSTTINTNGTYVHPQSSAGMWTISKESSSTVRKRAMEYFAVAERIDGYLAAAKAKEEERAKAEDEKKLAAEALIFYNALHDQKAGEWGAGDAYAKKHWLKVARAARELHGK